LGTVLRFGYEVRDAKAYFTDIPEVKLPAEMKDLAHVIIDRKAGHFDAAEFNDRYEDAVVGLVKAKQTGAVVRSTSISEAGSNVVDLMEALRKSIGGDFKPPPAKGKTATVSELATPAKPAAPSKGRKKAEAAAPAKATKRKAK